MQGHFHEVSKTGKRASGAKLPLLQATGDECRYELINHKPLK